MCIACIDAIVYVLCLIAQSFFGLGQSADITIELDDVEKRKKVDVKNEDGKKEKLPLYLDGETVTGKVSTISLSLLPSSPSDTLILNIYTLSLPPSSLLSTRNYYKSRYYVQLHSIPCRSL